MELQRKICWRVPKLIAGFMLIFLSVPCVVMMIYDVMAMVDDLGASLALGTGALIVAIAGGALMLSGFRSPGQGDLVITAGVEQAVLEVAQERQGRLAPANLTIEMGLGLDDAERVLEEMEKRGCAHLSVSDEGALEYIFPSLESTEEQTSLDFTTGDATSDEVGNWAPEMVEEKASEPGG